MKNIKISLRLLLCGSIALCTVGCLGDFEDINRNPNEASKDQLQGNNYLIGTNLSALQSMVVPVQEHMYQFNESLLGGPFGGYIGATPDGWLTKFETFNPSSDWRKWPFVNVMTDTYAPYREVLRNTEDPVAIALANLYRVAVMHRMTDTYGPIPYTAVVEVSDDLEAPYDSQKKVYQTMFAELDKVVATLKDNLTLSSDAFKNCDDVYYGDLSKWLKFANSLRLRMAMRLTYADVALAQQMAEQAVADGVITDKADLAAIKAPENRSALIYNSWGDHRVGADIINYMNGYEDPRREKMFTTVPIVVGGQKVPGYAGIRIGIATKSKSLCVSSYSNMQITSTTPYLWMNASEVTFLRAEGALRGWAMGGTAQTLYEQGVKLSFSECEAAGVDAYLANSRNTPAAYKDPLGEHSVSAPQSTITIAWSEGDSFEQKLERIITQKWIAIFPLGAEAWSEYRRTGYPRLLPAVENKSGGAVDVAYGARRIPYPVEEYKENATNLQAAISQLNTETSGTMKGDNMGTRVWWDCKPYNN